MANLRVAPIGIPARAQNINAAAQDTFPYPLYSKWFDQYRKLHPDIQINYQSIGSGGGISQLMAHTVDFGASDGPMNDDQLKQAGFRSCIFRRCWAETFRATMFPVLPLI